MSDHQLPVTQKQPRNSSIELLRIVAMFFVVLSHACGHSQFEFPDAPMCFNELLVQWGRLGSLGVDIFVLITGYYLCKKENSYQSAIRLLLQVWFYSYTLFLVCKFGFQYSYSPKECLKAFLPTIFQEYWFFTAYFVLCILHPYVNVFLEKVDRRTHRNLLEVMFFFCIVVPTFTAQEMYTNELTQLLFFYLVGAYFRLYPEHVLRKRSVAACLVCVSFFLMFLSTVVITYLGKSIALLEDFGTFFYSRKSLLVTTCAIGIFSLFLSLPSFTNRTVNKLSACTFGIYLIHDNFAVRHIIWMRIFRLAEQFDSAFLALYIIATALAVFFGCALIEYLRIRILGKPTEMLAASIEKNVKRMLLAAVGYASKWMHRMGV